MTDERLQTMLVSLGTNIEAFRNSYRGRYKNDLKKCLCHILFDDGYTDKQIAIIINRKRCNALWHRHKCEDLMIELNQLYTKVKLLYDATQDF